MRKEIDMRVAAENYKGIEYVQISSLPVDQKKIIWETINRKMVILILKDELLLNDCLQYRDYTNWFDNVFKLQVVQEKVNSKTPAHSFVLALK